MHSSLLHQQAWEKSVCFPCSTCFCHDLDWRKARQNVPTSHNSVKRHLACRQAFSCCVSTLHDRRLRLVARHDVIFLTLFSIWTTSFNFFVVNANNVGLPVSLVGGCEFKVILWRSKNVNYLFLFLNKIQGQAHPPEQIFLSCRYTYKVRGMSIRISIYSSVDCNVWTEFLETYHVQYQVRL